MRQVYSVCHSVQKHPEPHLKVQSSWKHNSYCISSNLETIMHVFFSLLTAQLVEIRKSTLAGVFCDNGDDIQMMQPKVFITPSERQV